MGIQLYNCDTLLSDFKFFEKCFQWKFWRLQIARQRSWTKILGFFPLGGSLGHPCDQSNHRWSPTCGCTVYNDLCVQVAASQVYTTVYNAQVASMQRRLFGKPRRRISGSAGGSHHGQECGFNCTTSCFGLNGTIFHV